MLYRVFQKFVPIENCILSQDFDVSLGELKVDSINKFI